MHVVVKTKDDVLEFIKMARIATLNLLFIYVWCEQIVGAHVVISFTQWLYHSHSGYIIHTGSSALEPHYNTDFWGP